MQLFLGRFSIYVSVMLAFGLPPQVPLLLSTSSTKAFISIETEDLKSSRARDEIEIASFWAFCFVDGEKAGKEKRFFKTTTAVV